MTQALAFTETEPSNAAGATLKALLTAERSMCATGSAACLLLLTQCNCCRRGRHAPDGLQRDGAQHHGGGRLAGPLLLAVRGRGAAAGPPRGNYPGAPYPTLFSACQRAQIANRSECPLIVGILLLLAPDPA